MKTLLLSLIAMPLAAAPIEKERGLIVIQGALTAAGKPVTTAQFYVAPAQSQSAVELDPSGRFEVKLLNPRSYSIDIQATGYAPVRRTVELDQKGAADLGSIVLEPLKKARLSVVVGPRGTLSDAQTQQVEMGHGSCANVRAQDESGCLVSFCATQEGTELLVNRYSQSGQLRPLGALSLADALAKSPRGGTFVTGPAHNIVLEKGAAFALDSSDAYCVALMHVDEVL